MKPEDIRRIALEGLELPARARVLSSEATSQRYVATVEVLDGAGEPTGQMLEDLPIDPLWLVAGGPGVFAPPAPDQLVAVVWMGGASGQPVVVSGGMVDPATPRLTVAAGDHSHQGAEWEVLMKPDEWRLSNTGSAILSAKENRFKLAADDDAMEILLATLDALINARTVNDTDTPNGSPGRQLPFNAGTIAAFQDLKGRWPRVLRS